MPILHRLTRESQAIKAATQPAEAVKKTLAGWKTEEKENAEANRRIRLKRNKKDME